MQFDFDTPLALRGCHVTKYDSMAAACGVSSEDAIPMWVADMDFRAAPCVLDALQREVDRGYLGYFGDAGPVSAAVAGWMRDRHGWSVDPGWIRYTHGVVSGFGITLEAFSEPGDEIVLFTPVYHAFFTKARAKGRRILESRLALRDGRYEMDLEGLASQITNRARIVVLCSPHNPGGRLWEPREIRSLSAFCAERGLILISDEIHMDLAFPDARHHVTALAAPEARPYLVTLSAASKGFNLAGGETGFVIIEDDGLRETYDKAHAALGGTPNRFGMIMTKAAFTEGGPWSAAVRARIAENYAIWQQRIGALPGIGVMDMRATYLSWVDFEGTGMTGEETMRRLAQDARIGVSPGKQFGAGGESWHRFNIALPRATLIEAIERIEHAFADLQ